MGAKETIPRQKEGAEVNVVDGVQLSDATDAKQFYRVVKERLLNVNRWKEWAGPSSAGFCLTNDRGQPVKSSPQEGNYFRIDIPGPGIATGGGYDWVRIEEIKEETNDDCEYVSIRVRPASSPVNDDEDTAHFYTDAATSNFIVKREGKKVTAGIYGRNETPNVEAETIVDKIRNAVVGTGAAAAFGKLQWKGLVDGLLKKE